MNICLHYIKNLIKIKSFYVKVRYFWFNKIEYEREANDIKKKYDLKMSKLRNEMEELRVL
jgi:hypothetical protein